MKSKVHVPYLTTYTYSDDRYRLLLGASATLTSVRVLGTLKTTLPYICCLLSTVPTPFLL